MTVILTKNCKMDRKQYYLQIQEHKESVKYHNFSGLIAAGIIIREYSYVVMTTAPVEETQHNNLKILLLFIQKYVRFQGPKLN